MCPFDWNDLWVTQPPKDWPEDFHVFVSLSHECIRLPGKGQPKEIAPVFPSSSFPRSQTIPVRVLKWYKTTGIGSGSQGEHQHPIILTAVFPVKFIVFCFYLYDFFFPLNQSCIDPEIWYI